MSKDISLERQINGETCGAASLIMVLKTLGRGMGEVGQEEIYKLTRSKLIPGSHFSALANLAAVEGLEVRLFHSEKNYFKNDGLFPDNLFKQLKEEYLAFLEYGKNNGVESETNRRITPSLLKKLLQENYLIILAGQLESGPLHSVVVHGYEESSFVIADPLVGPRVMSEKELEAFLRTDIGSWLIALRNDQSKVEEIESKKEKIINQARHFSKL